MENNEKLNKLKNLVIINYCLQAASILLGGIPAIIGVIIAYIKKDDAKDTWLISHFEWQIKTFWIGIIGLFIGAVTALIGIGVIILVADVIWVIYRVVKGVLSILENKSI